MTKPDSSRDRATLRIVSIYAIFSLSYIWLSDWILLQLVRDPRLLTQAQNYKGWAFVLFSAGLLFVLISRAERKREQVEEVIRQERDFSNAVLDSLPGVSYCYDGSLRLQRWNKNFERVTGYSSSEVALKSPLDFFTGTDQDLIRSRIQDVFATGRADAEADFVSKDGTRTPYYFTGLIAQIEDRPHLVGVGIDLSARKQAESALKDSKEQLRALSARLESLREEERIRISREIHDELGQKLTGLKMDLHWLETRLGQISDETLRTAMEEKIITAGATTDETMLTVQRIAAELRPAMLDSLGLISTLRYEAKQFETRTGVPVIIKLPAGSLKLSSAVSTTSYRIFQEVLTNVARHAQASKVQVSLEVSGGTLRLQVEDNGIGVSQEDLLNPKSLGLLGMTERAAMVNGIVRVEGAPGQGTIVRLEISIENTAAGDKESGL